MKSIGLQNVKAFADTGDIKIAPITLFVGQNSCGKSSIIRFPSVLSQTLKNSRMDSICLHAQQADSIDYGNFEDVIHKHQGNSFSFSLEYDVKYHQSESTSSFFGSGLFISRKVSKEDYVTVPAKIKTTFTKKPGEYHISISKFELIVDNHPFFECHETEDECFEFHQTMTYNQNILESVEYCYSVKPVHFFMFIPNVNPSDVCAAICRTYTGISAEDAEKVAKHLINEFEKPLPFPFDDDEEEEDDASSQEDLSALITDDQKENVRRIWNAFDVASDICHAINRKIQSDFNQLSYIGPFRSNPERIYRRDEGNTRDVGINGYNANNILINSALNDKHALINEVSGWFESAFHYKIDVVELGGGYFQIVLKDSNNSVSNIMDVGYGISQVLPIVTQIAESVLRDQAMQKSLDDEEKSEFARDFFLSHNDIIVIEQPELHLHPAAQSQLASLFVNAIDRDGYKHRNLLIETHSEHFIRALQVLIADPDCFLTRDMVRIYYVDKEDNGDSYVKEMEMNEFGQFLEEWPTGFFDKAYSLSRELMRAVAERKKAMKKV